MFRVVLASGAILSPLGWKSILITRASARKTEERKLESGMFVSWPALGRRAREFCRHTQRFRALVLPEGVSSVPSTHCGQLTCSCDPTSTGSGALFWPPWISAHISMHTQICTGTHKKYFKKSWTVVGHVFNPSTQDAEPGESL